MNTRHYGTVTLRKEAYVLEQFIHYANKILAKVIGVQNVLYRMYLDIIDWPY